MSYKMAMRIQYYIYIIDKLANYTIYRYITNYNYIICITNNTTCLYGY